MADEPGRATFHRNLNAHSRSSLDRSEATTGADGQIDSFDVDVVTLDEVLPDGYAPAFIKIDVEGSEVAVLRGARRILAEHKPLLVIEHGDDSPGAPRTRELHRELTRAGLRIFDIDGGGPYDEAGTVARASVGDLWSWVARV